MPAFPCHARAHDPNTGKYPCIRCHARAHDPNTGKYPGLFGLAKSNNVSGAFGLAKSNKLFLASALRGVAWRCVALRGVAWRCDCVALRLYTQSQCNFGVASLNAMQRRLLK